jgi:hypothetical protein
MKHEPDQLDGLLQQWARQHEPSDEHLWQLRQEIVERSALPGTIAPPSIAAGPRRWAPTQRLALAVALAGVALVVASALWPSSRQKSLATPLPAAVNQIPQRHLSVLLAETKSLFGQRLAWVAETDQDVSLGLDESDLQPPADTHVAVRVVVFQRGSRQDAWRPIWKGDVLTRAEELIHVTSSSDGSQWSLWTHVLPDGAVSIDSELAVPKRDLASWKTTSVQQPQVPCRLVATQRGGDEFQVWQTAAVVPANAVPFGAVPDSAL